MFDPGLFIHPGKGRFNPGAPTVLVLELRGVLPGSPGGDPQGFEVKAKIMTLPPRFDRTERAGNRPDPDPPRYGP